MKKLFAYFMAVVLAMAGTAVTAFAYETTDINLVPGEKTGFVNGEEVALDVPAKVVSGRTLVPMRFIAEGLDIPIEWNQKTKEVTVGADGEIVLTIGSQNAAVDGKAVAMDVAAVLENGRTLVPLRFIAESFGADVDWDQKEQTASIEYSDQMNKARKVYGQQVEGEQAVLDALDDKFAYSVALKAASFGDAKDGRGFHLVGSAAAKAAAQHSYDNFKQMGLQPEYHTFDATGWEYYASSMEIKGHDNLDYFITSAPHTPATTGEGLTAELIHVGKATTEELDKLDLTGKIALAEYDWDYVSWMNDLEMQVKNRGAVGLIYYCTNGYGTEESGMAEFVGDWSGKRATIPVWSMRQADGKALAAMTEKETITVTAVSDCKTIDNAKGYNVLTTIKGAKYPDEYIVINAHTDAYFHCLQDASAPVGILTGMAKAMVDSNYKPDRSIIFVTTDGEEAGGGDTFYDWLVGSWALVNDRVTEWGGKIVDAHTIEMIGDSKSTNFGYRVSNPMYMFVKAMTDVQNAENEYSREITVDNYMTTSSDEWSFSYMGYPTTRTIMENAADEVYHSTMDKPDRFSYDSFVDNLKAQTDIILRLDKQTFAPYDLSRTASSYQANLDDKALNAQKQNAAGLNAAIDAYLIDAWKLVDLNLEISELYNRSKADKKDLTAIDKLAADYNNDMRAAVKTITQGTQYIALDAVVSRVEYYQYLPPVFEKAIGSLKAGKGQEMLDNFDLDNDDQEQFTTWFSTTVDEATWQNSYFEALDPENSTQDYKWVTGVLLKYYDYYGTLKSIEKKVEEGDKDFAAEIATLTEMKSDASRRLNQAVTGDAQMWVKAKGQLPMDKAENILAELKK